MARCHALAVPAALAAAWLLCAAPSAEALDIWSGRTHLFVRPAGADWTEPVNQDRITNLVWITRKDTQGIFNIAQEGGYSGASPAGTEWATGDAIDYASLAFLPWVQWANSNPPGTVGVNAVVHLIAEDIYIDIRFESWGGPGAGGSFSYVRGIPGVVPAGRSTWGRIKSLFR